MRVRFQQACASWESGNTKRAFQLFLVNAKAGDPSSQANLGYLYDEGIEVRANQTKALYWYGRAYRQGDGSAANNIALIWYSRGKESSAIRWFQKAIALGSDDSALHLGDIYQKQGDAVTASRYYKKVVNSKRVVPHSRTLARRRLGRLGRARHMKGG